MVCSSSCSDPNHRDNPGDTSFSVAHLNKYHAEHLAIVADQFGDDGVIPTRAHSPFFKCLFDLTRYDFTLGHLLNCVKREQ
jgi:hypothetical protein